MSECNLNLHDELDNIMISNTTKDLELAQLQTTLATTLATSNITSWVVLAATADTNALAAID